MAKFKFSTRLDPKVASAEEYNAIKDDFNSYISLDHDLSQDNVEDESIRFRHLSAPATKILWKDCSDTIWSGSATILNDLGRDSPSGGFGEWEFYDTVVGGTPNCALLYSLPLGVPVDNVDLLEFTLWYFPYSICADSEVAPAIRYAGSWNTLQKHKRKVGMGTGFYTYTDQVPYKVDNTSATTYHPFLSGLDSADKRTGSGYKDRSGTVGYGGPIICTIKLPKTGFGKTATFGGYALENIDAFGMAIRHRVDNDRAGAVAEVGMQHENYTTQESKCSMFDRLFLSLVIRGH